MPTQSEISLNPTSSKGDILTFNGSSRISVPVGSNSQVIVSSSGSNGLLWQTFSSTGGDLTITKISSGVLTANASSYTISSIPDSYTDLRLVVRAGIQYNGGYLSFYSGAGTNRYKHLAYTSGADRDYNYNFPIDSYKMELSRSFPTTTYDGLHVIDFMDYKDTSKFKSVFATIAAAGTAEDGTMWTYVVFSGKIASTSTLTSIVFSGEGGNLIASDTTWVLYGIKRYGA